jgi:hypothetical protein
MASRNRILLADLKSDFVGLPAHLSELAAPHLARAARAAHDRIKAAYGEHRQSGHLQDGVRLEPVEGGWMVSSNAPYAEAFEWGSKVGATGRGSNRRANPIFIPISNQERAAVQRTVIALLRAEGFLVTGE